MFESKMNNIDILKEYDAEVGDAIAKELGRQRNNLELIASENIVSPAVMAAVNMWMLLKILQLIELKSCLMQILLMFNPTLALMPTMRCILHF